jgi:hypothetical protein
MKLKSKHMLVIQIADIKNTLLFTSSRRRQALYSQTSFVYFADAFKGFQALRQHIFRFVMVP